MPTDSGPARPRLLLVDDDPGITGGLAPVLERDGFDVVVAEDGPEALLAVAAGGVDVIVLDVMMPTLDGRETLRRLRRAGHTVPVVLLTSVGEAAERARALDEGADDYLNKPFDAGELIARVRAVLRRSAAGVATLATASTLHAGALRLDRAARRVWLEERELALTPKAFALLDQLITHAGEVVSKPRLLEVVWGYDDPVGTRAIDHRIAELRRVLRDDAAAPRWIRTVPGVGYAFLVEVSGGGR